MREAQDRMAAPLHALSFARGRLSQREQRKPPHPGIDSMNKSSLFALALLSFAALLSAQPPLSIGGEKLITLTRKPVSQTKPEFTSITLMPGRGI